jgi:hypothetical protein
MKKQKNPIICIDGEEVEIIEENDEKDIDDLLKFKISWKTILKVVIALVVLGIILYYSIIGNFPSEIYVYVIFFVCLIGEAVLLSLEIENEISLQTISTIKCQKCSFKKISRFVDGDFIFKVKDKCPNCEENLKITEIYSVKLAESRNEEKKENKMPKKN